MKETFAEDLALLETFRESDDAVLRELADTAIAVCEQNTGGGIDEWEFAEIANRIANDPRLERVDVDTRQSFILAVLAVSGQL
jgi:hypothetical protein